VAELEATIEDLQARVAVLEDLLVHFSREGDEITIMGGNLRVVNGTGSTETTNGLGNVIIGYNEERGGDADRRDGSHMLVLGRRNNYTRFGGMVGGEDNEAGGSYASVTGGRASTASGDWATVAGGNGNRATGTFSSVSGGSFNEASGYRGSVSGGNGNQASGVSASVSGGIFNHASGVGSCVAGGRDNVAGGSGSSVSGGESRTAPGTNDWRAGSLFQDF